MNKIFVSYLTVSLPRVFQATIESSDCCLLNELVIERL